MKMGEIKLNKWIKMIYSQFHALESMNCLIQCERRRQSTGSYFQLQRDYCESKITINKIIILYCICYRHNQITCQ